MDTKRTTKLLRLLPEDWEIIRRLKEHYGIASDNEVIRMALRSALRELPSSTAPNKEVALPPPHSSWGLPCALTCVALKYMDADNEHHGKLMLDLGKTALLAGAESEAVNA
jgi:hypothetical protein